MTNSLNRTTYETTYWLGLNENELTKDEILKVHQYAYSEINEDQRKELVQIREKYDTAFRLLREMAQTDAQIDALSGGGITTKDLAPADVEVVLDTDKVVSTIRGLRQEVECLKRENNKLRDMVDIAETEASSAWQAAERNKQLWLRVSK